MLKPIVLNIEDIYVPADRRKEVDAQRVDQVAETIIGEAEEQPIHVREDMKRGYILVKGIHRLEARKALGEQTIRAFVVSARRH